MVCLQVALGDVGQVQKVERDIKQNVYLHVSELSFLLLFIIVLYCV